MRHALLGLLAAVLLAAPATAEPTDSGDLPSGAIFSHTFDAAAEFAYHCHPHPWMEATVTVVAASGRAPANHTVRIIEPASFDVSSWTFEPATLDIEAGDTVTWVNEGDVVHTVTELDESAEGGHHGEGHMQDHGDSATAATPTPWVALFVLALGLAWTRRR